MRKNKKAGIITIVDLTNYGNRLQNYAVCEVLKRKGIDSETLDFKNCKSSKRILCEINQFMKDIPILYYTIQAFKSKRSIEKRRFVEFGKFSKKYFKIKSYFVDKEERLQKLSKKYDYFVIGSDQIWNPEYGHTKSTDFAYFARNEQKICFSPSFGVNNIKEQYQKEIKQYLLEIPNISVREKSGVDIVKDLTGKKAEVLIDPTMMLNADDWRKVSEKSKVDTNKKYILSYFLGERSDEYNTKINYWKDKYGLDEYKLLDKQEEELYCANPGEFIELIDHATLVCTDSFHGTVFSILFGKPFVVFQRNGNGAGLSSRLDTLLETFKLTQRYMQNINEQDLFKCEYNESYNILEKERIKVDEFLNKSF